MSPAALPPENPPERRWCVTCQKWVYGEGIKTCPVCSGPLLKGEQ